MRILRFLMLLLTVSGSLYGQSTELGPMKPNNDIKIPPPPDAAKLGAYGDIQSNFFNGIPNIAIPIYDLSVDHFSLPISLSYNASGFKVDEVASSAGLGWSLNAGGKIAISVRGRADNTGNRYFPPDLNTYSPEDTTFHADGTRNGNEWAQTIVDDNFDTEQDIYYYNFGNYSGRFFMDYNLTHIIQSPYSNLKIVKNGGFGITDIDGVNYQFSQVDMTSTVQRCSVGIANARGVSGSPSITGYGLRQITTANGRKINFTYETVSLKYLTGMDETRYLYINDAPSGICPLITNKDRLCAMISWAQESRLTKIALDDSSVVVNFIYDTASRQDIALDSLRYGNRLKSIEVYNNAVLVKRYTLNHDYFRTPTYNTGLSVEDQSLNSRLKLLSVKDESMGAYVFEYNENDRLPKRLSFAQDLYGYYNGKIANTTSIATTTYGDSRGADRSSTTAYKTALLLQKMTYPTGGYTEFKFEPHQQKQNLRHTASVTRSLYQGFTSSTSPALIDSFTLSLAKVNCQIAYNISLSSTDRSTGSIRYPDGTTLSLTEQGFNTISSNLPAGKYSVIINNIDRTAVKSIAISVTEDSLYTVRENIPIGGVRIAKLTDTDNFGVKKNTYFDYNIPDSTDVSSVNFTLRDQQRVNNYFLKHRSTDIVTVCHYTILGSSPFTELGTEYSDNQIGYQYVTVKKDSLGFIGRTRYKFSIKAKDLTGDILLTGNTPDWMRGKNLETITERYDAASASWIPVMKEQNIYKTNVHPIATFTPGYPQEHEDIVGCFRLRLRTPAFEMDPAEFDMDIFSYSSGWLRLDKRKKTYYSPDGQVTLSDSTMYAYNVDHVLPTTIQTTDSKGQIDLVQKKYPQDFAGIAVYDSMVNRSLLPVIMEEEYLNNVFLQSRKLNYDLFTNKKLALPSFEEMKTGTANAVIGNTYQSYDTLGNLQQQLLKNGIVESFVLGYNNQYPVAKISGASYDSAKVFVNMALVNSIFPAEQQLRDELDKIRIGLKGKALVSTYTFKPGVGVSSIIDSKGLLLFYQYDSWGRLKTIRDKDNNVLKFYDYQYQVPLNQ